MSEDPRDRPSRPAGRRARRSVSRAGLPAIFLALSVWAAALPPASPPPAGARPQRAEAKLTISGAWALYPMVQRWAEEYGKVRPGVRFDIQAGGAGKGIADVLSGMVDLGMVSRDVHPAETAKGALAFAVVRDAVVSTVSAANPFLPALRAKGLTRRTLEAIWISGTVKTWGAALGASEAGPIHVYTRSDACGAAETWAAFFGRRQEDLGGVGVYGDPGLADAVRRDPLGLGYNNVNFAYDAETLRPVEGLAVIPLDLDESGAVEPRERFTATRDEITRAIAAGIYPAPPARDLYLVSKGRPAKAAAADFLAWVLTEGQRYAAETGYIALGREKLAEGLRALGR